MVSLRLFKSTELPSTADQADLFPSAIMAAHSIYGMLSDFSIAVMDMLLSLQARGLISGHIVEIGVFKGKSAAVLATHAAGNKRLVLVDVTDQFERDRLTAIKPDVEFIVCPSEQLRLKSSYRTLRGKCRLIHIDASHQFEATQRELAIADDLMVDNGIVVLDDFANLNYSQNIAAIYKYLFTTKNQAYPVPCNER
jgi:predicted O-methyltransferase YrrM